MESRHLYQPYLNRRRMAPHPKNGGQSKRPVQFPYGQPEEHFSDRNQMGHIKYDSRQHHYLRSHDNSTDPPIRGNRSV